MKYEWRNDGEPVDGFYEAVVDLEDGSTAQVFRGATYKAVADALLKAQGHATRRLQELRGQQRPEPTKPASAPQPLSADQRMQLARDISDPAKTDAAVEAILRARGIEVAEMQAMLAERRLNQAKAAANAEATRFADETPDWHNSDHNKLALVNFMDSQGMTPVYENFVSAFERLQAAGLLQAAPPEEPPSPPPQPAQQPERISPATSRPRTTLSTSIRGSQGTTTSPSAGRPRYTKRDLQLMPSAEYAHKLQFESGFEKAVEAAMATR